MKTRESFGTYLRSRDTTQNKLGSPGAMYVRMHWSSNENKRLFMRIDDHTSVCLSDLLCRKATCKPFIKW